MSITPQVAVNIGAGQGRLGSFLDMVRPGPARPLPPVAGMQKAQVEAMAAQVGPPIAGRAAGPQATTIFTPAGVQPPTLAVAPSGLPTLRGLTGVTIPKWLKYVLVGAAVVGGGLIVWKIVDHRRRVRALPDFDY